MRQITLILFVLLLIGCVAGFLFRGKPNVVVLIKRLRITALLFTAFIISFGVIFHFVFQPEKDMSNAAVNINQLLIKAGGADKVCDDADRLFKKYGTDKSTFFHDGMLADYPAISSIGKVDFILPSDPPFIKIRVGNHLYGFIVRIIPKNSSLGPLTENAIVLGNGRIYVTR